MKDKELNGIKRKMENKKQIPLEEMCPFAFNSCRQDVDERKCFGYYEHCIVYQRLKVLNRNPVLTGLQRFQLKYKDFDYGRQLGI